MKIKINKNSNIKKMNSILNNLNNFNILNNLNLFKQNYFHNRQLHFNIINNNIIKNLGLCMIFQELLIYN